MQKKEANFSIKFRHWLMANPQISGAYEMKDTRGAKAFLLREFKPEQENFADAIRNSPKGVFIRTEGVTGLPDYIYLRNAPSWVVIKYPNGFVIIDGVTLSLEKKKSTTLLWSRACELAHTIVK